MIEVDEGNTAVIACDLPESHPKAQVRYSVKQEWLEASRGESWQVGKGGATIHNRFKFLFHPLKKICLSFGCDLGWMQIMSTDQWDFLQLSRTFLPPATAPKIHPPNAAPTRKGAFRNTRSGKSQDYSRSGNPSKSPLLCLYPGLFSLLTLS